MSESPAAQYARAVQLLNGDGVEKDERAGYELMLEAASAGVAEAAYEAAPKRGLRRRHDGGAAAFSPAGRDEKGRVVAHGLLTATLPIKLGGDGMVVSTIAQTSRFKVNLSFEVRNQDGELVLRGTTSGQILR